MATLIENHLEKIEPYQHTLQNGIGGLFVFNGLMLAPHSVISMVLQIASGLFLLPIVRNRIETTLDTDFPPLVVAGVVATLFFAASIVLLLSVDPSQLPDAFPV